MDIGTLATWFGSEMRRKLVWSNGRADLNDLGVNMDGTRIDFTSQGNDARTAIVSGVHMQGYQCPVIRMYVVANNAAGD